MTTNRPSDRHLKPKTSSTQQAAEWVKHEHAVTPAAAAEDQRTPEAKTKEHGKDADAETPKGA